MGLLGVYSKSDKNDVVFVFQCRVVSGSIQVNDEAKNIRYFSQDMIPENTIHNHQVRIQDFFSSDALTMKKQ